MKNEEVVNTLQAIKAAYQQGRADAFEELRHYFKVNLWREEAVDKMIEQIKEQN